MTTTPVNLASPFLAEAPAAVTEPADTAEQLNQLDGLIAQALAAKQQAEQHKAVYDSLREQICSHLRDLDQTKLECASGKARLKETKSGWTFSEATQALAIQLKAQQDIEKRNGVAQPSNTTISADVFPL